jgi:hypothetical protein
VIADKGNSSRRHPALPAPATAPPTPSLNAANSRNTATARFPLTLNKLICRHRIVV